MLMMSVMMLAGGGDSERSRELKTLPRQENDPLSDSGGPNNSSLKRKTAGDVQKVLCKHFVHFYAWVLMLAHWPYHYVRLSCCSS